MLKNHFSKNELGHVVIGGVDSVELAERFGTPLYVMDEGRIRQKYRRFHEAFSKCWPDVLVCYAYKANSNLAICKILHSEGAGAEVSSGCELKIAHSVGVPRRRIVFNGPNKSEIELEAAIANDVLINIDNLQELHVVERLASKLGRKASIGFRVNPDISAPTHPYMATGLRESKFGFDVASGQAIEAYREALRMENVRIKGIHCHIGSQILDATPFEEAARKMMTLVVQLKTRLNIDLEVIDFGGGLGIPYEPGDHELTPDELAQRVVSPIKRAVKDHGLIQPTLVFEPGRYLVADSGVLLTRVGYCKERPKMPMWVAVDAGMNVLIRPTLYGAYHHIEVASKMHEKPSNIVNIGGPLCESGDFLGKKRFLPAISRGDLIAVFDVGAYGMAMSSQFIATPRPAVVLVNSGRAELIRLRETYDDLTRLDRVPERLR